MTKLYNTFLLDRSGSMETIKAATIEGFNSYIVAQQESEIADDIIFSLITFDTQSTDQVHTRAKIKDVSLLNNETFLPRLGTPLIDACCKTIYAVDAMVAADPGPV